MLANSDTITRMTRHRAFNTAAARRRANPIVWEIDGKNVALRPSVTLDEIADLVEALQAETPPGMNEIRASEEKRKTLCSVVRTFLEPGAVKVFIEIEEDLDFTILTEMVTELIAEYTGQANPTQASPSSDGSSETGNSLTAGAAVEE
jgi:hypothetical protein